MPIGSSKMLLLNPSKTTGFPQGWTYYQAITIDHTKVTATQSNYVALVTPDMISTATHSLWSTGRSDGGDIRFCTDTTSYVQMPREVVAGTFDQTNKKCVIFVNMPTCSHTSDTTIYMYYGNSTATEPPVTDTYGRNAVWSKVTSSNWGYDAVYHGGSNSSFSATDSAGFHDGTPSNVTAHAGPFGTTSGAGNFNGTSSQIDCGSFDNGSPAALSIEAWYNDASAAAGTMICTAGNGVGHYSGWNVMGYPSGMGIVLQNAAGTLYWGASNSNTTNSDDGNWHYGVMQILYSAGSYAAANAWCYLDGSNSNTGYVFANGGSPTSISTTDHVVMGYSSGGGTWGYGYYTGYLAETRLIQQTLTSDWIATTYNNYHSPSTFVKTVGTPTAFTPPVTSTTNPNFVMVLKGH